MWSGQNSRNRGATPPVRVEAEKSISGAAADSDLLSVRILVHRQPPTGSHSRLGAIFSVCGQICGQQIVCRSKETKIITGIVKFESITGFFTTINQLISMCQRLHWYKQRTAEK